MPVNIEMGMDMWDFSMMDRPICVGLGNVRLRKRYSLKVERKKTPVQNAMASFFFYLSFHPPQFHPYLHSPFFQCMACGCSPSAKTLK